MLRLWINAYYLWLSNVYREKAERHDMVNNFAARAACEKVSRSYAAKVA